jgi:hypothetical protein
MTRNLFYRSVVMQLLLIRHEFFPRNEFGMSPPNAHFPLLLRQRSTLPSHLTIDQGCTSLVPTKYVCPRVRRVAEDISYGSRARTYPTNPIGAQVARRNLKFVSDEVLGNRIRRTIDTEALKDEPDGTLDMLVRVESEAALRRIPFVAGRRCTTEFSTTCLVGVWI